MQDAKDILQKHYTRHCDESQRLLTRSGQVERFVTFAYIQKAIEHACGNGNPSEIRILETGAGTGAYSLELAKRGGV